MDPASLLQIAADRPAYLDDRQVTFVGSLAPIHMPLAWVPAGNAGRWALEDVTLPFTTRVQLALAADLTNESWAAISRELRGRNMSGGLERVLAVWAGREQVRLGLPRGHDGTILAAGSQRERNSRSRSSASAVEQILPLFESLLFPRWGGPVVFIDPESAFITAEGDPEQATAIARPSLPMVMLPKVEPFDQRRFRSLVGTAMSDFILTTCDPPGQGWPGWLSYGLRQLAGEQANGKVGSPLRSLRSRQQAGGAAIITLLREHSEPQDPASQKLATAIVTLLTTKRRRKNLAALLDFLRNGAPAEEAIRLSYGLSPQDMIRER